jgi:hypothetical protein
MRLGHIARRLRRSAKRQLSTVAPPGMRAATPSSALVSPLARVVVAAGMRLLRIVVLTSFLLPSVVAPAVAFDLTGHWVGKASCKGLGDGRKFVGKTDVAADVSENGRDLNVEFQGFSFLSHASGVAVPSVKNADKGEVGFVACGNEPEPVFGVTGRAKVSTKPSKGTGSIKLVAIVAGKDLGGIGVTDGTFTCTGSLKRTSTTDPVVGDCPISMITVR